MAAGGLDPKGGASESEAIKFAFAVLEMSKEFE